MTACYFASWGRIHLLPHCSNSSLRTAFGGEAICMLQCILGLRRTTKTHCKCVLQRMHPIPQLSITNCKYNAINTFSNQLIVKSAGDGSVKPGGAKPTGHGVAGLRARRHHYPDAMCGGAPRTWNEQPHRQPDSKNFY